MQSLTLNLTYTFDLNGSLPAIPVMAAYSMRRLFPNYTGPQLQIRRSLDNLVAELYLDARANYTTLQVAAQPNITNYTDILDWMSVSNSIVSVNIVYDQSGRQNNLMYCNSNNRPTLKIF